MKDTLKDIERDKRICKALIQISNDEVEAFMINELSNDEPKLTWKQKQKIKSVIYENEREQYIFTKCRTSYVKKIIVTIIIVILLGSLTMSVEAIRINIFKFFYDPEGKYMELHNTEILTKDKIYEIYIPIIIDGFKMTEKSEQETMIMIMYESEENWYRFIQAIQGVQSFDTENMIMTELDTIHGQAIFYQSNDFNIITWNYDGYSFTITGTISLDEMIKLLESIDPLPVD